MSTIKLTYTICNQEVLDCCFREHVQGHLEERYDAKVVGMVHDEVLLEMLEGPPTHYPNLIDLEQERREKPTMTMEDLRRDCFPREYTWWQRQPPAIEEQEPTPMMRARYLLGRIEDNLRENWQVVRED